jgi:hypothetical protein
MEQVVSLRYKYSIEDPIRVAQFINNQGFIYRHDVVITSGMVFLAFVTLIVLMANSFSEINLLGTFIFSSIPAVLVGVLVHLVHGPIGYFFARRRVLKFFKSSSLAREESLIEFSGEGIKTTNDLASSFVDWKAIAKVNESEHDLIMNTGNEKYGWYIPKRAFVSESDLSTVKNMIREALGSRAHLLS